MNKTLIHNWNSMVKPEDIVFFLGDFCFKNTPGGKPGEGRTLLGPLEKATKRDIIS